MSSYRLGVDIGGTFTDFVLLDEGTHTIEILKVPSTPRDPARAVVDGVRVLSERLSIAPASIAYFVHGTTLAVNTLIERSGSSAGLLVTQGTRGHPGNPPVAAARSAELLHGSSDAAGAALGRARHRRARWRRAAVVERPVDLDEAEARRGSLVAAGCHALAICFLHAYANDAHEQEVKARIAARFPGLYRVHVERRVAAAPRVRACAADRDQCARGRTDARVLPARWNATCASLGVRAPILSTKSNGGVMTARTAGERSVETLFSGPASGVIGAHWVATHAGFPRVITFDMGGTSADVSIVTDRPSYSTRGAGRRLSDPHAVDRCQVGRCGRRVDRLDRSRAGC